MLVVGQAFLREEDGAPSGCTAGVEDGSEACKELGLVSICYHLRRIST